MPSVEFITLGKGRLHFGGGISGIQLQGRPFIVYFLSERIQLEFLIAQCFSDTDALLHGTGIMADMILFGKLYQFDKERGDYHSTSRMYPSNCVPLQFRDAVAYTDHSHTQFAGSHIICQACHETAVDGSHQLKNILLGASGGGER